MAIEFVPEHEDLTGLTRAEVMALVVSESDMEDAHAEMLSEIYGEVQICGLTYDAAHALKEIDPIAFRCSYADYVALEYVEIDPADYPETLCSECGENEADDYGMCPSCLHNAYRSGWMPGKDDSL